MALTRDHEDEKINLRIILSTLGYDDKIQQIALIKLAAFTGCFSEIISGGELYKDKIISDQEAQLLLYSGLFDSWLQGKDWLIEITQKNWFRRNQALNIENNKSSITTQKELKHLHSIDTERGLVDRFRWDVEKKDKANIEQEVKRELTSFFKQLELMHTVDFKEINKTKFIIIHGGKDDVVKDCIDFINKDLFSGTIYYLTNARFLFNDEMALAPILAKQFTASEQKQNQICSCIQTMLDEENKKDKDKRRDWTRNLPDFKMDILQELEKKQLILQDTPWPSAYGWYYKNPGVYEYNSKLEGLNYSAAGWPTAMDMVEHWLHQHFKTNIAQVSLYASYPNYKLNYNRIANTEVSIRDWYRQQGQYLPPNSHIVGISNNLKMHYIPYQDRLTKEILRQEQEAKYAKSGLIFQVTTIGPGFTKENEDRFNLTRGLDSLAKTLYFASRYPFFKARKKSEDDKITTLELRAKYGK